LSVKENLPEPTKIKQANTLAHHAVRAMFGFLCSDVLTYEFSFATCGSVLFDEISFRRPCEKNEYHFNCFSVFDKLIVKINGPLPRVWME